MPKVDPTTGQPVTDAPDQADQDAAGGEGYGGDSGVFVDSNISTNPDNPREAEAGSQATPRGEDPGNTAMGSAGGA